MSKWRRGKGEDRPIVAEMVGVQTLTTAVSGWVVVDNCVDPSHTFSVTITDPANREVTWDDAPFVQSVLGTLGPWELSWFMQFINGEVWQFPEKGHDELIITP